MVDFVIASYDSTPLSPQPNRVTVPLRGFQNCSSWEKLLLYSLYRIKIHPKLTKLGQRKSWIYIYHPSAEKARKYMADARGAAKKTSGKLLAAAEIDNNSRKL